MRVFVVWCAAHHDSITVLAVATTLERAKSIAESHWTEATKLESPAPRTLGWRGREARPNNDFSRFGSDVSYYVDEVQVES